MARNALILLFLFSILVNICVCVHVSVDVNVNPIRPKHHSHHQRPQAHQSKTGLDSVGDYDFDAAVAPPSSASTISERLRAEGLRPPVRPNVNIPGPLTFKRVQVPHVEEETHIPTVKPTVPVPPKSVATLEPPHGNIPVNDMFNVFKGRTGFSGRLPKSESELQALYLEEGYKICSQMPSCSEIGLSRSLSMQLAKRLYQTDYLEVQAKTHPTAVEAEIAKTRSSVTLSSFGNVNLNEFVEALGLKNKRPIILTEADLKLYYSQRAKEALDSNCKSWSCQQNPPRKAEYDMKASDLWSEDIRRAEVYAKEQRLVNAYKTQTHTMPVPEWVSKTALVPHQELQGLNLYQMYRQALRFRYPGTEIPTSMQELKQVYVKNAPNDPNWGGQARLTDSDITRLIESDVARAKDPKFQMYSTINAGKLLGGASVSDLLAAPNSYLSRAMRSSNYRPLDENKVEILYWEATKSHIQQGIREGKFREADLRDNAVLDRVRKQLMTSDTEGVKKNHEMDESRASRWRSAQYKLQKRTAPLTKYEGLTIDDLLNPAYGTKLLKLGNARGVSASMALDYILEESQIDSTYEAIARFEASESLPPFDRSYENIKPLVPNIVKRLKAEDIQLVKAHKGHA